MHEITLAAYGVKDTIMQPETVERLRIGSERDRDQ